MQLCVSESLDQASCMVERWTLQQHAFALKLPCSNQAWIGGETMPPIEPLASAVRSRKQAYFGADLGFVTFGTIEGCSSGVLAGWKQMFRPLNSWRGSGLSARTSWLVWCGNVNVTTH